MKYKIAIIAPYAMDDNGGVQNQIKIQQQWLEESGHHVRIFGHSFSQLKGKNFYKIGRSYKTKANGSISTYSPSPYALIKTSLALKSYNADIVHIHEPGNCSANIIAALLQSNTPIVCTWHSNIIIRNRLLLKIASLLWRNIITFIPVSSAASCSLNYVIKNPYSFTLPNTIDLEKIQPYSKVKKVNQIIFIGPNDERKGYNILLQAFFPLIEKYPDLKLSIHGRGSKAHLKEKIHKRHQNRILFHENSTDIDLYKDIASSRILCAPSLRGESFGVILLEGMALGTPVIASDIEGYNDVIRDGYNGVLTQAYDPVDLQKKIELLLENDKLTHDITANGLEEVKKYDCNRIGPLILEIYKDAIKKKSIIEINNKKDCTS